MKGKNAYEVQFTPHARRSLKKLKKDQELIKRLLNAIEKLALNPRPPGYKKLKGEKFDNLYRYRIGNWRILYAIEEEVLVVIILDFVPRDRAYR